jgi:hypothetical protein
LAGPSASTRSWFCGVEAEVGRGGVSLADEAGRSGASGSVAGRVVLVSKATAGGRLQYGEHKVCRGGRHGSSNV